MVALLAVAFALTPAPASAQGVFDVCKQGGAGSSAVCTASGGNNLSGPNGIIIKVSNIFAFIGGVAAVIVIMVGGFVYITSAGDAGKASGGKNAVVYATVGLVVIVLGRAIIGFVISKF
jgi:hypothetical protein